MVNMYDNQFDDEFEDDFEDVFEDDFEDEFEDAGDVSEDASPAKKKSSFMLVAIIAVVILLGGGFVVMQLMGGDAPVAPVEQAVVVVDQQSVDGATTSGDDVGFAIASDIVPSEDDGGDFFNDFSSDDVVVTSGVAMPDRPVDAMGTLDMGNMGDIDSSVAEPVLDTSASMSQVVGRKMIAPVTVVTNSLEDPKTLSRLDVFEDRLVSLENWSSEQSDSVSSVSGGDSALLAELRQEVKKLKDDVRKLKNKIQVSSSSRSKPSSVAKTRVRKVKPHKVMPAWVIRSAQPGKALLSSRVSKGTVSIKVGDVLSGLGSIRSIGINDNGLWEVNGTLSSVIER